MQVRNKYLSAFVVAMALSGGYSHETALHSNHRHPPAPSIVRNARSRPRSSTHAWNIITWASNTKGWNRKLHVSGYRIGCSGNALRCFHRAQVDVKRDEIGQIVISMPLKPQVALRDALEYSALSRSDPFLAAVGFDDFVDRDQHLLLSPDPDIPGFLESIVSNVRRKNRQLKFGITLYEDELGSRFLRPPLLPQSVARSVGYVSLYLHYREDAKAFPVYVQEVRSLFPNARILAGSYAYDRVDYIPCGRTGNDKCTPTQDIALYKESIRIQAKMLRDGKVDGIEFYPGFFGKVAQWPHWREPDICASARRRQCIADTRIMRRAAVAVLSSYLHW